MTVFAAASGSDTSLFLLALLIGSGFQTKGSDPGCRFFFFFFADPPCVDPSIPRVGSLDCGGPAALAEAPHPARQGVPGPLPHFDLFRYRRLAGTPTSPHINNTTAKTSYFFFFHAHVLLATS
jgi:hypothetical protein